uniref:Uncharacterized protein n=1 Tax=Paramormyrops kingsleyae TaxID=1676925 RepID=A0A3B3T9S7_9TELE
FLRALMLNGSYYVKYAAIGIGIGLFFSLCFVALKLYMLRKHMLDNELSGKTSLYAPFFVFSLCACKEKCLVFATQSSNYLLLVQRQNQIKDHHI